MQVAADYRNRNLSHAESTDKTQVSDDASVEHAGGAASADALQARRHAPAECALTDKATETCRSVVRLHRISSAFLHDDANVYTHEVDSSMGATRR